eukprot:1695657-Rhodomonas_salina.1
MPASSSATASSGVRQEMCFRLKYFASISAKKCDDRLPACGDLCQPVQLWQLSPKRSLVTNPHTQENRPATGATAHDWYCGTTDVPLISPKSIVPNFRPQ